MQWMLFWPALEVCANVKMQGKGVSLRNGRYLFEGKRNY